MPGFLSKIKWGEEFVRSSLMLLILVVAIGWKARGYSDENDKRITVLEEKVAKDQKDIVPRAELETHFGAINQRLDQIDNDVRDMRKDQRDYFHAH